VPHFAAEEQAVFPLLRGIAATADLITRLLDEHGRLRAMAGTLDATADRLAAFADLLERHIRLEERQLFALYQEHVPHAQRVDVEARVRGILERPDDTRTACDLPRRV
jgi:hemerythrin-like domain-containing protein